MRSRDHHIGDGGLSYMHSDMYGTYALQESVRHMRGTRPAQIPDAKISVCHGVGGMFAASGTIIFSSRDLEPLRDAIFPNPEGGSRYTP
jgi:Thiolase C-terminal domain-like